MPTATTQTPDVFEILKRGTLEALEIHRKRYQQVCVDCGTQFIEDEPERYQGLCFSCSQFQYE